MESSYTEQGGLGHKTQLFSLPITKEDVLTVALLWREGQESKRRGRQRKSRCREKLSLGKAEETRL